MRWREEGEGSSETREEIAEKEGVEDSTWKMGTEGGIISLTKVRRGEEGGVTVVWTI